VCRELYEWHAGRYTVSDCPRGRASELTESESETVQVVVESYGSLTGRQLSALTHREAPWLNARKGISPGERGNAVITLDAMAEYYGALAEESEPGVEDVDVGFD
jgi:uncharacterized phage-associated protein